MGDNLAQSARGKECLYTPSTKVFILDADIGQKVLEAIDDGILFAFYTGDISIVSPQLFLIHEEKFNKNETIKFNLDHWNVYNFFFTKSKKSNKK